MTADPDRAPNAELFTGFFADHTPDWNHLDVNGLSRLAAIAWPVAQRVLELS